MEPVVDEFASVRSFALRDFVFMMGEHVVDTASVQVECFTQIFTAHGAAFDMPAGATGAPGAVPLDIAVFIIPSFPEGEVADGIFGIFVIFHPVANALAFHIDFSQLTVLGEDVKISRQLLYHA